MIVGRNKKELKERKLELTFWVGMSSIIAMIIIFFTLRPIIFMIIANVCWCEKINSRVVDLENWES